MLVMWVEGVLPGGELKARLSPDRGGWDKRGG